MMTMMLLMMCEMERDINEDGEKTLFLKKREKLR